MCCTGLRNSTSIDSVERIRDPRLFIFVFVYNFFYRWSQKDVRLRIGVAVYKNL